MEFNSKAIFLIDVDAILDTRLGTYRKMGADVDAILAEGYKFRIYDRFDDIVSYEDFEAAYSKRDLETLKVSNTTGVIDVLQAAIKVNQLGAIVGPFQRDSELIVNTHPYNLSEEDSYRICCSLLELLAVPSLTIRWGSYSLVDLDPSTLKSLDVNYWYVMYGEQWLNYHVNAGIIDDKCPRISMYLPFLVRNKLDDVISGLQAIEDGEHPTDKLSLMSSPYINMLYEPSHVFTDRNIPDQYPFYINPEV